MKKMLFFLVLFSFIFAGLCLASPQEFITEGTYIMGDNDTPTIAEKRALDLAKRDAIERAGTYIESSSKVENLQLTQDEITTIAAGTIQTTVLDKKRITNSNGSLTFWVKVKCVVDNDRLKEYFLNSPHWKQIYSMNWGLDIPVDDPNVYFYYDTNRIVYNKELGYVDCWIKEKWPIDYIYLHIKINTNNLNYQLLEEVHYNLRGVKVQQEKYDNPEIKLLPVGAPLYKVFSIISHDATISTI